MSKLEHDFAEVNGIKLHYVEQGEGPLVILLHGFPEFWYSWHNQLPALAQHFHTVAVDLRGYNQSDKPKGVENYRTELFVKDIAALIKHFGQEHAMVVGHDLGGTIGWQLARYEHKMVSKLAALNSPHPKKFKEVYERESQQRTRSEYMHHLDPHDMGDDSLAFFTELFTGSTWNPEAISTEDIQRYADAFPDAAAFEGPVNYYKAMLAGLNQRSSKPIDKIDCPVLQIWGEKDEYLLMDLTRFQDHLFETPPRVEYIANASHWVQNDQPEVVNRLLIDFLLE